VKWKVLAALGLLALVGTAWQLRPSRPWAPTMQSPRPARCDEAARAVDLSLPWPAPATGQTEFPLSADGCLRLREDTLWGHRRRWQLLELQPDGGERALLEADFAWRGAHVGVALVLQQPRAPEPFPQEWDERGFTRLAWFSADGGSTVRHFEADRRLVEVRTGEHGVERREETLPPFNGERNPGLPRERFPAH
jgi:hypothetical protein